jgi:hypothetical protein
MKFAQKDIGSMRQGFKTFVPKVLRPKTREPADSE